MGVGVQGEHGLHAACGEPRWQPNMQLWAAWHKERQRESGLWCKEDGKHAVQGRPKVGLGSCPSRRRRADRGPSPEAKVVVRMKESPNLVPFWV